MTFKSDYSLYKKDLILIAAASRVASSIKIMVYMLAVLVEGKTVDYGFSANGSMRFTVSMSSGLIALLL